MDVPARPTVREALAEFRRVNGLALDEASRSSWTCRFGPITIRLPNFGWRRSAILAHDLHHVLIGCPCTLRGEFQMAAWEFGAGRMPHWAARLFCLPLVVLGLLWSPRRMLLAFLGGRRSHSLHGTRMHEELLAAPLHVARTAFIPASNLAGSWTDYARFALLILEASLILLSPPAILVCLWIVIGAS